RCPPERGRLSPRRWSNERCHRSRFPHRRSAKEPAWHPSLITRRRSDTNQSVSNLGQKTGSFLKEAKEVFSQVKQARPDHLSILLGLGQDDRALNDRNHVLGQAQGAPTRSGGVFQLRLLQIFFQKLRLLAEAGRAHRANLRVGLGQFLGERSQQTTLLGPGIARHLAEEIDVAEDALQWIFLLAKHRLTKKLLPRREKPFRDQLPEMLFAFEIVKKASLR